MFCPLPWIFTGVRNNGDLRFCCQANQGPDRGLLRKDDGSIYHAAKDDINESKNAQKLKDARKDLLNNKWPADCIRCQREEASGIRSRFTYEKELWKHYIDEDKARELTKEDGTIDIKDFPSVYFDLRFGNKCNLACRTCSPTDSSAWYKEHLAIHGPKYHDTMGKVTISENNGKYSVDTDAYNWYQNEDFWKNMRKQIPHIRHVHMVGGEPLMIKEQYKFLEECIKQGHANHITIEHNSNITTIPDKAWELWKHFEYIKIGASIDGIGKVNDYIRYPSKWETIEKNLRKLDNGSENIIIWIACTVNILNIYYLPEFFDWNIDQNFKKMGNQWIPIASLHPLHDPSHMNTKALPLEVKQQIKEKFDSYKFKRYDKEAHTLLKQYSDFMFAEDYTAALPAFFDKNNKLDTLRNVKMKDYLPELYKLLEGYDIENSK